MFFGKKPGRPSVANKLIAGFNIPEATEADKSLADQIVSYADKQNGKGTVTNIAKQILGFTKYSVSLEQQNPRTVLIVELCSGINGHVLNNEGFLPSNIHVLYVDKDPVAKELSKLTNREKFIVGEFDCAKVTNEINEFISMYPDCEVVFFFNGVAEFFSIKGMQQVINFAKKFGKRLYLTATVGDPDFKKVTDTPTILSRSNDSVNIRPQNPDSDIWQKTLKGTNLLMFKPLNEFIVRITGPVLVGIIVEL